MTRETGQADCNLPLFAAGGPGERPAAVAPADTRREAREQIAPELGRLRTQVLVYIEEQGDHGATDQEVARGLAMQADTSRARRVELVALGLVRDSGQRRPTGTGRLATVWVAAGGLIVPRDAADEPQRFHGDALGIGLGRAGLMIRREKEGRCAWCGSREMWQSVCGLTICENCHPPAVATLVSGK